MNPDISKLSPVQLTAFVNKMVLALGSATPNPFGVDPDLVHSLGVSNATAVAAITLVGQKKDSYTASMRDRDARVGDTAYLATSIVRLVLANPNLSPAQLAELGLSPRNSGGGARIRPVAPTSLTTALLPTGEVRLDWTSSNPYGVVYRIEAQVGSAPWTFVDETTAKKITLSEFSAGVTASFRVLGSKNGIVSSPSPVAMIYHAVPSPGLRLAA